MSYEQIQKHEYQDIYRLKYGVLLKVNKFTYSKLPVRWCSSTELEANSEKVKGLKGCCMVIKSTRAFNHTIPIPVGTIIYEQQSIVPTADKNNFLYELKTTGSCFSGDLKEFQELLNTVQEILNKY